MPRYIRGSVTLNMNKKWFTPSQNPHAQPQIHTFNTLFKIPIQVLSAKNRRIEMNSLVLRSAFLPACFYISPVMLQLALSQQNVRCCPPLLLFLQCLTNLFISLPDPVFFLEQHWLKPENIVNNVCVYAQKPWSEIWWGQPKCCCVQSKPPAPPSPPDASFHSVCLRFVHYCLQR